MKFSNILLATTAALAGTAQADECVTGLLYCGETLLEMLGVTAFEQLFPAVSDAVSDLHLLDGLFKCNDGGGSDIALLSFCIFGCQTGGTGQSARCGLPLRERESKPVSERETRRAFEGGEAEARDVDDGKLERMIEVKVE